MPPGERLGQPVPETLSTLLMACLEKKPERRPSSSRAVLAALESFPDVPPWTDDQARSWWTTQGTPIIERARAAAMEAHGREGAPASTSGTVSFIRRADARES